MLTQIIQNTPSWVFILFCALLYLGITRTRPRAATTRRLFLMPLAIAAFSLYSIYSAFGGGAADAELGSDSVLATALLAWLGAAAAVLAIFHQLGPRRDVRYQSQTQQFLIPGSWLPLLRLMAVFFIKYVFGAMLATQASLHDSVVFAAVTGVFYGALSSTLLGSAWRIWRIMLTDTTRQGSLKPTDIYVEK